MAQINLLDSDQRNKSGGTSYSFLSRIMGGVLILAIIAYVVLFFHQNHIQKQLNEVRDKTAVAQKEAESNSDRKELLTRQGQLQALNPLLKDHVYWSGLLPELARLSLRQSTFVTIEASANGNMVLSVQMPTYADLDNFLQVFDLPEYNKQFSNVRVLSINKAAQEGVIAYVMRVQLTYNTDFIKHINL